MKGVGINLAFWIIALFFLLVVQRLLVVLHCRTGGTSGTSKGTCFTWPDSTVKAVAVAYLGCGVGWQEPRAPFPGGTYHPQHPLSPPWSAQEGEACASPAHQGPEAGEVCNLSPLGRLVQGWAVVHPPAWWGLPWRQREENMEVSHTPDIMTNIMMSWWCVPWALFCPRQQRWQGVTDRSPPIPKSQGLRKV